VAAALRAARLERPAPLALVLPQQRAALRGLRAAAALALVVAAAAVAALAGFDPRGGPAPAARTVAVVASAESPDSLRELRRAMLIEPIGQLPRNRRLPDESA
jgi:hypothetical protein